MFKLGIKKIKLTQNKFALVDEIDYEYLNQWKWQYFQGYAKRGIWDSLIKNNRTKFLHRFILDPPNGFEVDHINGNRLDNRRTNLRIVNRSQNNMNRSIDENKFKGIHWNKNRHKWYAEICVNKTRFYLGCYKNELSAARAYNEAAIKYFGEFAKLNKL